MNLQKNDQEVAKLIAGEEMRQKEGLVMIASENYVSPAVREAVGSVLENKYAEGYPGKRYYTGNYWVDQVEQVAQSRAKKLFRVPYVNVQPYSGSPANLEIFGALLRPCGATEGQAPEIVLSQELSHGGHLSMGQEASITGRFYQAKFYHLTADGEVNWEELYQLARKFKPKIIWSGGTGYTKIFQWEKYSKIAQEVGAYFVADVSHIAGLIVGGAHPSPVPFAHVVMTTTHKTLRGPRGAMIMVTNRGLKKDPDLGTKIDKSVFPGHQGGPHMNEIAGIAVALREAQGKPFAKYAKQIVKNSKALSLALVDYGFTLIGGVSENHMVWIDLRNKDIEGWHAHVTLEAVGIYGNKQTIPNDSQSPFYPSGYRLGTAAVTSRGMKEKEMKGVAGFIDEGVEIAREITADLTDIGRADREKDQEQRKIFKDRLKRNKEILALRKKVISFSRKWPVP